jgi:Phosphotransferase enzyme family
MSTSTRDSAFLGLLDAPGSVPYLVVTGDGAPRWAFPMTSSTVLRSSLGVHTPATVTGIAARHGVGLVAAIGLGFLLPGRRLRARPPLAAELSRLVGSSEAHVAVASSAGGERCVLVILDASGQIHAYVKVARSQVQGDRLRREGEVLANLSGLGPNVSVPEVIYSGMLEGFHTLAITPVPGRPGLRPWRLDERRAEAAAAVFRTRRGTGSLSDHLPNKDLPSPEWRRRLDRTFTVVQRQAAGLVPVGLTHGDFAPWNLLEAGRQIGIVDWEAARADGLPYWDLWHFAVQAATLGGRRSHFASIPRAARGQGSLGAMFQLYARMTGMPEELALYVLMTYLVTTGAALLQGLAIGCADPATALEQRARLLDEALGVAG